MLFLDRKNIERPQKFDRKKYDKEYKKEHYTQIVIRPKKEIADIINKYCEDNNINRSQLIINAVMEYIKNNRRSE